MIDDMLENLIEVILVTVIFLMPLIAWLMHIYVCLMQAKYVLLLVGVLFFPVGVIHGAGIIIGVEW